MNRTTLQELLAIGTLVSMFTKRKKIRAAVAVLADLVAAYDASRLAWATLDAAVDRNEPVTIAPADAARIAALGRIVREVAR